jgi:hypothetical protein
MEEKIYTLADMQKAFVAGQSYGANELDFENGEVAEVTASDFWKFMLHVFDYDQFAK